MSRDVKKSLQNSAGAELRRIENGDGHPLDLVHVLVTLIAACADQALDFEGALKEARSLYADVASTARSVAMSPTLERFPT